MNSFNRDSVPIQFENDEPINTPVEDFKFKENSLSVKEFVDHYRKSLPMFARVTEGFCSPDEGKFTFSVEDTYWISHVKKQNRIIGKGSDGLNYSIPFDHPLEFYVLEDGETKWGPSTIENIFLVDDFSLSSKRTFIEPVREEEVTVWQGAETQDTKKLKRMQLIDKYEETYLVGSPVIQKRLHDYRCPIPVFIPIKLAKAVSLLANSDKKKFEKELKRIKDFAQVFPNAEAKGNPEIMIFSDDQVDACAGAYEYIDPYELIGKVSRSNKRYEEVRLGPTLPPADTKPPSVPTRPVERQASIRPPAPPPTRTANPSPSSRSWSPPVGGPRQLFRRTLSTENHYSPNPPAEDVNAPITSRAKTESAKVIPTDKPVERPMPIGSASEDQHREEIYFLDENPYEFGGDEVYAELGNVPAKINFETVSVNQVSEFLRLLKLHRHIERFKQETVDGSLLRDLDKDMLKGDFGFSGVEATKLVKFVHHGWRPKEK